MRFVPTGPIHNNNGVGAGVVCVLMQDCSKSSALTMDNMSVYLWHVLYNKKQHIKKLTI